MYSTHYLPVALIACTLLFAGCGQPETPNPPPPNAPANVPAADPPATNAPDPNTPVLKIALYIDGRVTADGAPIAVDDVYRLLDTHQARGGVVWCYREGGDAAPHPNALIVVAAITQRKLSLRLSIKPDYSDGVGSDGKAF